MTSIAVNIILLLDVPCHLPVLAIISRLISLQYTHITLFLLLSNLYDQHYNKYLHYLDLSLLQYQLQCQYLNISISYKYYPIQYCPINNDQISSECKYWRETFSMYYNLCARISYKYCPIRWYQLNPEQYQLNTTFLHPTSYIKL